MAAVTDDALTTVGNSYLAIYNTGALGNSYRNTEGVIIKMQGLKVLPREQLRILLRLS